MEASRLKLRTAGIASHYPPPDIFDINPALALSCMSVRTRSVHRHTHSLGTIELGMKMIGALELKVQVPMFTTRTTFHILLLVRSHFGVVSIYGESEDHHERTMRGLPDQRYE